MISESMNKIFYIHFHVFIKIDFFSVFFYYMINVLPMVIPTCPRVCGVQGPLGKQPGFIFGSCAVGFGNLLANSIRQLNDSVDISYHPFHCLL